jgi:Tfp pilus assembly pilus retraction ATPase PilT
MGPAGSGKSTYCSNIVKHCVNMNRQVHVINLDPAAEEFHYPLTAGVCYQYCIHHIFAMVFNCVNFAF